MINQNGQKLLQTLVDLGGWRTVPQIVNRLSSNNTYCEKYFLEQIVRDTLAVGVKAGIIEESTEGLYRAQISSPYVKLLKSANRNKICWQFSKNVTIYPYEHFFIGFELATSLILFRRSKNCSASRPAADSFPDFMFI
ncbi:uncharacterized protein LOC115765917 [Drosophila novamexicana]|uniref:uncharacterized protein LOC115765917 n=1 Tax=Drosophila novamexicana TaxID=47314 RepID=UPI0011E5DFB6|nr:uncharacterized protein LOC115765917 [Drosophila novamexicana]